MGIRFPFGKRGFLAATVVAAGLLYWQARNSQREKWEREWEAEIEKAAQEGEAIGRDAVEGE